jgi:integrase
VSTTDHRELIWADAWRELRERSASVRGRPSRFGSVVTHFATHSIEGDWPSRSTSSTRRRRRGPRTGARQSGFRSILRRAGLDAKNWTPRELRHSFVSLLSERGVSIETIADLMGHAGTRVTEAVYRHQLRPVLLGGAVAMDQIFEA